MVRKKYVHVVTFSIKASNCGKLFILNCIEIRDTGTERETSSSLLIYKFTNYLTVILFDTYKYLIYIIRPPQVFRGCFWKLGVKKKRRDVIVYSN